MPVVLEQVTHAYASQSPATNPALSDVSLSIDDGEFLGVIGHTGSGKSTLVQLMSGLLQPTHGRVVVDGRDLADRASRKVVRQRIGMVFQYPEHQLFADTVADDIAFGPRALGLPACDLERRVADAIELVGMDICTVGHRSPFELSGGQMRRVAIAGVLAAEPTLLILDEPMAGLDPEGRCEMRALLRRLNREGVTVVMVSHDMDDIAALADRVLVLRYGRTFAHGTPGEVFSRATELREIGLGVPHAVRFAARLVACGVLTETRAFTAGALAEAVAAAFGVTPPGEAI